MMTQTLRSRPLAVLILAAGQGTRMKSRRPKVLHALGGLAMIQHVLAAAQALKPRAVRIVIAPNHQAVAAAVAPIPCAIQTVPRGTGDAVQAGLKSLGAFKGDVLVLYGDGPLVTPETLKAMLRLRRGADLVYMGFRPRDPAAYGRMILDGQGRLDRIVEYKDANASERAVTLCNGGPMLADAGFMTRALKRIAAKTKKGEVYLTDLAAQAKAQGLVTRVIEASEQEVMGVNSRAELAAAEAVLQNRLRMRAMVAGVTMIAPETVFLSVDAQFGQDVVIEPFVVIGPGVRIGDEVQLRAYSHLEGVRIDAGAVIGPYARLRPGTHIEQDAHVGNFVELKKTRLRRGAKANHLTYLGDADVGEKANIGAGTITCNYDGFDKFHTDIGAGAFIGSNSALVAPVRVGRGAIIGAGSVITRDVLPDSLALGRGQQTDKAGWARTFRAKKIKSAKKNKK